MSRRPIWLSALLYLSALLLALLAVGPAIYLLAVAFLPADRSLDDIGRAWSLRNFMSAWNDGNLARPLLNSVLVTASRTFLNVFLAALAAYPLARMSFRGRDLMLVLILATMMIPEQVIAVPMFAVVAKLGLIDTLVGAVLPMSVSAFGIYMCRQAFLAVPWELEEAARIDGASTPRIWWSVMLPLSAPTLATLALFSLIASWSDLMWPLIVLQSRHNFTLPVAINELMGQYATNPRLAYAGSVLALVPIIAAFILSQRWFKPQIFAGAVKG